MRLHVGNLNYSSWSIRPWFFVHATGIPCEVNVLYMEEESFGAKVAGVSPSKRVPSLELPDGSVVWDSFAIGLTLAELFPEAGVFPSDPRTRRLVYSACAEMHSSFADMRRVLTCNARRRYAKDAWRTLVASEGVDVDAAKVLADCGRVEEIFATLLKASGGPFLGGRSFGFVDAYFVPVLSRFRTYAISVSAVTERYKKTIEAMPAHASWLAIAAAEAHTIPKYEYDLERR